MSEIRPLTALTRKEIFSLEFVPTLLASDAQEIACRRLTTPDAIPDSYSATEDQFNKY
jgi:hypothetical protein